LKPLEHLEQLELKYSVNNTGRNYAIKEGSVSHEHDKDRTVY